MADPRRFSTHQRDALYIASDGKCSNCGIPLAPGWHADHVQAYSLGGETDTTNGQALCPRCNLSKGAGGGQRLRPWQRAALDLYAAHIRPDFMAVATPGAGKTTFALTVADALIRAGDVSRVIVVVPTKHLCSQWEQAAHRLGIGLNPELGESGRIITSDYVGAAVTYQAVASAPQLFRHLSAERSTLVILDEVHHCGDSKDWGAKVRQAFEPARRRLCLSGTPFRTDNAMIPFVRYDNGVSVADFSYGYASALNDRVCRTVVFPHYDSDVEWAHGMNLCQAKFSDVLSDDRRAEQLRAALRSGEFLPTMLREANDRLTEVRAAGDVSAGGLVIAMEQEDARQIARMLSEISGEQAVLAVSDDPDANRYIKAFGDGRQRWLVAVRMVSEGVDIPRLRVGVYATNITAELFFRQAVGRLVRINHNLDEQTAYMFIPEDARLLELAKLIKEERAHALKEEQERRERGEIDPTEAITMPLFAPLGSTAAELGGAIYDRQQLTAPEIIRAREFASRHNATIAPEVLAQMFREVGAGPVAVHVPVAVDRPATPTLTVRERENGIRKRIQSLVGPLARRRGCKPRDVHAAANEWAGIRTTKGATIEHLERKVQYLESAWRAEGGS